MRALPLLLLLSGCTSHEPTNGLAGTVLVITLAIIAVLYAFYRVAKYDPFKRD